MVDLPAHYIPRPPMADARAAAEFDRLFESTLASGTNEPIDYRLPWPRWQFICHVVEARGLIVHGSQNCEIDRFEPRKSNDAHAFGDRKAVYGASDGLWSMYYAILDRATHPMLLLNAAARLQLDDASISDPYYFLSISQSALDAKAFRPGMLYFLPGDSFEEMPPQTFAGRPVYVQQWASLEPVTPIARIAVAPEDFPLLDQIRGHDDETVLARVKADPDGFPWLDQ